MVEVPKELHYTKEHEWVKVEGNIATVGITDFAQQQLTDIVFVELPAVGKTVEQGKSLAVVESVKSASEVYAPVSGEVVEVNEELKKDTSLVNKDPFGKGWFCKLKLKDASEVEKLMNAEQYEEFTAKGGH